MKATRRPAEESRMLLINAAVEIIRTEGYGALSARRLAEKVGLKRQIVHYYFGTIDELFLAVVRHYGETGLARFSEAFQSGDPLRVLWEVEPDASATAFAFMAMASHRPAIRAEMRKYLAKFRKLQADAISRYFAAQGRALAISPIASAMIIQFISQGLAAEAALGAVNGHKETKAVIERILDNLSASGQLLAS
jgi:AcrR family transcriptional regulator